MNPLAALDCILHLKQNGTTEEIEDFLWEFSMVAAEPLLAHVKQLEAHKKRMEEALRFYTLLENCSVLQFGARGPQSEIERDKGQRAREALKGNGYEALDQR